MIALACDHGGYALMQDVKKYLDETGVDYKDFGTYSTKAAIIPYTGRPRPGVVSGECDAASSLRHRHRNLLLRPISERRPGGPVLRLFFSRNGPPAQRCQLLAMGGRVLGTGLALKIVETYLNSGFDGGRHARRFR